MKSLIDYIGIKGAPDQSPESGEFINRLLPGLPMESMVKVTEEDQVTFLEAWADIQKYASKRFNTAFISEMQKRYKINTIQRPVDILKVIDTTNNQTAAAEKWRGFTIELTPDDDQLIVYSAFQSIYIQHLRLYRKEATAAVPVSIFDMITGEKLAEYEFPATATAGWTQIKVEERFNAYRLFVAFDSTDVNCVHLDLNPRVTGALAEEVSSLFGAHAYTAIKGAQTDRTPEVFDTDITKGLNTYGLSGTFAVQCSYEPIVKQNREVFLLAWAYLLGHSIIWFRLNSSRINRWTIGIDKEKGLVLQDEFEALFNQELTSCLDGINLEQTDACLQCNFPIMRTWNLP